ncbi:unnamed protein product [Mytilus edulis]|uniref:Uncharacterized protein n=1 Tax=Mytilus edulis TaxID=6550 RepID=A0A8S3R9P8_MYTED|nr:unnamed protein product [Mytilus edulis]
MAEGGYSESHSDESYLKDNNLYTIKRSTQCSSITITFRFHEIYSTFERMIFKQYPGNLFKRLKENHLNQIWYSFYNKNGEKVSITLSKSTITLVIRGKGCNKWLDKDFGEFGKQLHKEYYQSQRPQQPIAILQNTPEQIVEPKLQQSKTGQQPSKDVPSQQEEQGQHISKQPSANTITSQLDKNFKLIVSPDEFQEIFAHPYSYYRNPALWPKTTILLYKYGSNATTKFVDIPEGIWRRVKNKPRKHAESIMISDLEAIQGYLKQQPDYSGGRYKGIHTVEVILSYSPCSNCSTQLCDLKNSLEQDIRAPEEDPDETGDAISQLNKQIAGLRMTDINFQIIFSNFYLHRDEKNREGLINLSRNNIKLDILTGEKWKYFYMAILGFELPKGREDREKQDEAIFQNLQKLVLQ